MKATMLLVACALTWIQCRAQLTINEVMAQNETTLADACGSFDDWVEVYNGGDVAVDLTGYSLTDNAKSLRKFVFKARSGQHLTIAPHGYLLIWCDEDQLEGPLHTNFRLNSGGEWIGLVDPAGNLLDSVSFGAQAADISWGRNSDRGGEWCPMTVATPCRANAYSTASSAYP